MQNLSQLRAHIFFLPKAKALHEPKLKSAHGAQECAHLMLYQAVTQPYKNFVLKNFPKQLFAKNA
jgi:hypothetical protein